VTPYRPRLYLLVEGQTEEIFAHDLLIPHLSELGIDVFVQVVLTNRARGIKGGGKWIHYKNHLSRWMKQHAGQDCRFSLILDLYGRPRDLPEPTPGLRSVELAWAIEDSISANMGDRRLIPYVQCHEFETLLFTDLSVLQPLVAEQDLPALEALRAATADIPPEEVNDRPESAPSKRLEAALHDYDKVTHGPLGTAALGLGKIRARCPHFDRWLRKLEALPVEPVWPELERLAVGVRFNVEPARAALVGIHEAVVRSGEPWALPVVSVQAPDRLVLLWSEGNRSVSVSVSPREPSSCSATSAGGTRGEPECASPGRLVVLARSRRTGPAAPRSVMPCRHHLMRARVVAWPRGAGRCTGRSLSAMAHGKVSTQLMGAGQFP
jgi:hypothetical protein